LYFITKKSGHIICSAAGSDNSAPLQLASNNFNLGVPNVPPAPITIYSNINASGIGSKLEPGLPVWLGAAFEY